MPRTASHFVFHDPAQRRWSRLKLTGFIAGSIALLALASFFWSLAEPPHLLLPGELLKARKALKAVPTPVYQKSPAPAGAPAPAWTGTAPGPASGKIIFAFADPSDPSVGGALKADGSAITHVCVDALELTWPNGTLRVRSPATRPLNRIFPGPHLILVLSNFHDKAWRPEAVEDLARAGESAWKPFIDEILSELKRQKARGILIDFREVGPESRTETSQMLARIARDLAGGGFECWISAVPDESTWNASLLPPSVRWMARLDLLPLPASRPGPAQSVEGLPHWLAWMKSVHPLEQWLVCLDAEGADWNRSNGSMEILSFADAMARAHNAGVTAPDTEAGGPHFAYRDDEELHEVWFQDAASAYNIAHAAVQAGVAGVGAWQLGSADHRVWTALQWSHRPLQEEDLPVLANLPSDEQIAHVGDGDFVTVSNDQEDGWRTARIDAHGWLVFHYERFPSYPTLFHEGAAAPDEVALTFDDGPDSRWTPKILDILKAKHVPAAFFVLGNNVEKEPALTRRILAEGHEIGLHTYTHPNLALQPDARTELELNASQRLLEWVTGRSTLFFRPPYNADTRPRDASEVRPLVMAQNLGYITVLESIDPEDWDATSAQAILDRVKSQRASGGIILLHDAGGNRRHTVAALPLIIDWLHQREDRIVPLSQLLGQPRDSVMPPAPDTFAQPEGWVSQAGFSFLIYGKTVLGVVITAAAVLLLIRSLSVAVAAFIHHRRPAPPRTGFSPPVSIILPAFNEAKVIRHTLEALLRTTYAGIWEIILVDDGSTDDTAAIAGEMAATDPRIHLLRLPNAGKSRATEKAISIAQHDILVFLDADTLFESSTLEHLVAPFEDPGVGAVSGHAHAGNTRTWIGRFQDLEYTCGFNLDRRAYDLWDAITVVPGAVGAVRRTALDSAGGIPHDTLAEDTDLTLALHRAGWKIRFAPLAKAWTEVPESLTALFRQRFRWAYGTMQCAWKHRELVFDPGHPGLGFVALPGIWIFQIFLVATSPVFDLLLLAGLASGAGMGSLVYLAAFSLCDVFMALVGCAIDHRPWPVAFRILPMRLLYRPLLALVVWRALLMACRGAWVGWGKQERSASVQMRNVTP